MDSRERERERERTKEKPKMKRDSAEKYADMRAKCLHVFGANKLNEFKQKSSPYSPFWQVINPKGMRSKKPKRKYKRNQDTKLQNASRAKQEQAEHEKLEKGNELACQRQSRE